MADMASELEAAAFRLRRAGEDDLARKLTAAMRDAVKTVPGEIRAGLKPKLPDRYAEVLDADTDIKTIARTGGASADARVSVYAAGRGAVKRRRFKRLDGGVLEHPLFGDRTHWYKQELPSVQPRWFTGPAEDAAPQVQTGLERALEDIAAQAEGA